ncbi:pleckstrin (PH) domain-containing protein [Tieghemostelium lacteum]|uniref:Pleckstrin (PH) domain-containing protein n=1 Tax=Tieghemostelium lacteum TaxID=361077 RepID=A0A152A340_TIELA|nr:pleckstrin (PH) domain-containing protein [Tieghemostelium lacteum]|eukprot:KYR00461.1 pleckstrin (PH) domain-containing protein [Tieghemostelium lacteum]
MDMEDSTDEESQNISHWRAMGRTKTESEVEVDGNGKSDNKSGYNTLSGGESLVSPNVGSLTSSGTITINKSLHRKNLSSLHRTPTFKPMIRKQSLTGMSGDLQKTKERRANILREILATEQAYVSFLKVIVDIYLCKIREKDILTQTDIENIFSNIESIKATHDEIHSKIKERIEFHQDNNSFPMKTIVSDIFKEYGPFLRIYSIFVNNYYNNAMQLIKQHSASNKKFKAYLQECKYSPYARKLDLNDLLIMPAQKVPRYILLLEELIQFTSKEDVEYNSLQEAKEVMKTVASFINSSTHVEDKSKEGSLMVARLQQQLGPKAGQLVVPHRKLIRSGELYRLVITTESSEIEKRKVVIYLFNDILIYAIKNKFWRKLSLDEVWIRSSKKIEGYDTAFEVYSKSLSCIFIEKDDNISNSENNNNNKIEENIVNSGDESKPNLAWSKLIENTINSWLQSDQKSKEKRAALLDDVQIQKDLTFEERQFYFESLNLNRKQKGQSKDANNIIETGIVEDRKKKIEGLINIQMNDIRENSRTSQSDRIPQSASTSSINDLAEDDSDSPMSPDTSQKEKKKKKSAVASRALNKTTSTVNFISSAIVNSSIVNSSNHLSHIVLTRTNILKQGYLTKIGEVVKNWKRRWFIMENNYLFYLKNQRSNKVLGRIPLIGSKVENVSKEQRGFNIVTKTRTYLIIADSEKDTVEWVGALNDYFSERERFIASMKQQKMDLIDSLRLSSSPSSWQSASPNASTSKLSTSLLRLSIGSSSFSSLSNSGGSLCSQPVPSTTNTNHSRERVISPSKQLNDQPLSSTEDEYDDNESTTTDEEEEEENEVDDEDEDEEEEDEESDSSEEEFDEINNNNNNIQQENFILENDNE